MGKRFTAPLFLVKGSCIDQCDFLIPLLKRDLLFETGKFMRVFLVAAADQSPPMDLQDHFIPPGGKEAF